MKNIIRASRKAGKKASVEQVQSSHAKTARARSAKPDGDIIEVALQEHSTLKVQAAEIGLSPAEFIKLAIVDKCHQTSAKCQLIDLEDAVRDSEAMMQLLCDKIEHLSQSGYQFSGPEAGHYVAGIVSLTDHAKKKLWTAFIATACSVRGTTVIGGAS